MKKIIKYKGENNITKKFILSELMNMVIVGVGMTNLRWIRRKVAHGRYIEPYSIGLHNQFGNN